MISAIMKTAYRVRIKGRVTGVGFRYSALDKSEELPSLQGYVRNVGHGEVEALIQGEVRDVESMLAWLHEGPPFGRVDSVELNPVPMNSDLTDFHIS